MASKRKIARLYCFLDMLCFVLVGLTDLVLHVAKVQPRKQGFFCDDDSIKKPLRPETISTLTNLFAGLGIVVVTIIICETLRHFVFKCKQRGPGRDDFTVKCGPIILKPWQRRTVFIIFMFGFGAIVTNLFTDVGKLMIGRLRPYFLAVCKPDLAKLNCSSGLLITEDICTGNEKDIFEARVSFPSGHSSFSAYTMVFLAIYLEAAIPTRKTTLFKPFLQITALMIGLLCALSRIFDDWHHWGDVLTGLFIGTFVAGFIVFKPLQLFSRGSCTCCQDHVAKFMTNNEIEGQDHLEGPSTMSNI